MQKWQTSWTTAVINHTVFILRHVYALSRYSRWLQGNKLAIFKKKKKKNKDANVTYSGCEYHFRDMPLHISDCKGVLSQGHVAFLKM